jgi:hypothetical protein
MGPVRGRPKRPHAARVTREQGVQQAAPTTCGRAAGGPQKLRFAIVSCTGEDADYPVRELLYHSPQTRGWQTRGWSLSNAMAF